MFFDLNSPHKDSILCTDEFQNCCTYRDALSHATVLRKIISPRTLAIIYCKNTIGSLLSYIICLHNKIVPILIDDMLPTNLKNRFIEIYEPNWIFQPSQSVSSLSLYQLYDYEIYKHSLRSIDMNPSLALLLTTSGSTGSPKLVRQSYQNLQANAESIDTYLELTKQSRPVTTLPMHYTFGLSIINSHLNVGATIFLTQKDIFTTDFWEYVKKNKITSIAGVPFTYECLERLKFTSMSLPHLELLTQAGGKLTASLQQKFAEYAKINRKRFIIMYGQTEATARISYLPYFYALSKLGSIGIAIPGGALTLIDDNGLTILNPYQQGELVYSGDNVTLGYAETRDDLSRGDDWNKSLLTGDIAYFDEDRFFYIVGRRKRFVKIQGKRINLDEIESHLKECFSAIDIACTGTDQKLLVYITSTLPSTQDDIIQEMLNAVQLHPIFIKVISIRNIPKTKSGKTDYKSLEKGLLDTNSS